MPIPILLAESLDVALPQTQCTRCGFPDCRSYAQAMADGAADINRCPPGGAEGIERLSRLTGRPVVPLDPEHGREGPRALARIDEAWCIGCTLCLKACPVDCIVGGPKTMHTIIEPLCTGCELCLPVCPVDCIAMLTIDTTRSGWQAWSQPQADEARARHDFHRLRLEREQTERGERFETRAARQRQELSTTMPAAGDAADAAEALRKRQLIDAAVAKARAGRLPGDAGIRDKPGKT